MSDTADLKTVLERLQQDMRTVLEREAAGEDVRVEKEQIAAQTKAVQEAQRSELDELTRLRAEAREREEREIAEKAVKAVVGEINREQEQSAERIRSYAMDAIKSVLGGEESVEATVKRVLGEHPGTSRYVGTHATEEGAKHVAGGGYHLVEPTVKVGANHEVKALEESKSIVRLMGAMVRVKSGIATPAEREWIAEKGAKALAEGTGSAGGVLVPQEWMPDVLGLLRAQAVVRRANPRIIPFDKLMNQTSISSGATAYYTAENAAITPSEPVFAEAPLLTPKNLTGLVPVSNYLLNDAPQAEEIVRADLAEVLALREDLAFLRGTGGGGEPRGFRNIVGVTLDPIQDMTAGDGMQPSMTQLRAMRAVFRAQNAGQNIRPVWFFNTAFITYLEGLTDADGHFLLDSNLLRINDDLTSGTLDGIPFFATNQLPANLTQGADTNTTELYLVNLAETVVGINQDLQLDVSDQATYTTDGGTTWVSAFQNNQSLFRAVIRHDIAHRRPSQILVQRGVIV